MNNNFDKQKLFSAINQLDKNSGIDKDKLKNSVESNDISNILSSLSPEQSSRLNQILSDKAATEQILSSPKAQQLLKALFKDGNNNG